jgi:putative salt-induced outer membrane protein
MSMTMPARAALLLFAAALAGRTEVAYAQAGAEPPGGWTGSAGAGLTLTHGNNDTSTINASYELKRETGDAIVRSTGLLVWGKSQGILTSDRVALDGRVERKLGGRTSVFGQTQYLRDAFKSIDHLVAPTAGFSHLLIQDDRTELGIDVASGIVWEQSPRLELQTDTALTAGQQFTRKLTATTELKQRATALWKLTDFGDALYTIGAGIAASVTAATQIKVEVLDTFKAEPKLRTVRKNDVAVLVSFVYKFE